MDISYDYYRVFYYVAKCGNMTQAAKMLVNNQPNLTRVIKTLEGELGCPLFIRSNRGMQLTPEGERLFAHVRIAVENMEAGEAEIAESRNLAAGSVYVAVSEVALHCVLLPVLEEYRRRYPGIRLKVSNHSTPQAIETIRDGIADMAIVTTPTVPSAMTVETTVRTFREVAVCSTSFPDRPRGRVGFAELLRYPLISLGEKTKSFEWYSRLFADRGLRYQPDIETATADQILPMVKANLGIGFVPEEFLRGVGDVAVIETEEPLPEREIRIVKRREQAQSLAAKELEHLVLSARAPGEERLM